MAQEIQRRIEADGGKGLAGGEEDAGAAPGTETSRPTRTPPAAEPRKTDTGAPGGPPDTIPYSRFKEVNDRYSALKGFERLTEFGYDPDSLGRLAAFEAQYLNDPIGTWRAMSDNLDLPQELRDALEQHLAEGGTPGRAEGEQSGDASTGSELDPQVQKAVDWVTQQQQQQQETAAAEQLDRTISLWDSLDSADGLTTPEQVKLMAIGGLINSGQEFGSLEDLVKAAREPVVEYRSSVLGDAVRTGRTGLPSSVPGGVPGPSPAVDFGSDIRAATRAAQEALERGELPSMKPGA